MLQCCYLDDFSYLFLFIQAYLSSSSIRYMRIQPYITQELFQMTLPQYIISYALHFRLCVHLQMVLHTQYLFQLMCYILMCRFLAQTCCDGFLPSCEHGNHWMRSHNTLNNKYFIILFCYTMTRHNCPQIGVVKTWAKL